MQATVLNPGRVRLWQRRDPSAMHVSTRSTGMSTSGRRICGLSSSTACQQVPQAPIALLVCHNKASRDKAKYSYKTRHVVTSVVSERMMGPSSRDSYSEDEEDTPRRSRPHRRVRTPPTSPHIPSSYTSPTTPCTQPVTSATSQELLSDNARLSHISDPAQAQTSCSLFDDWHVNWTPALVAYAPFGTLLACFRMACWVLGILIDAPVFRRQTVISTYLKLLGFTATWRNLHLLPEGHHVMVSNHTTSADLMVLFQLPQRYTHLITSAMPARVTKTTNLPVVLRPASPAVYEQLAQDHAAASPSSPAPPVHVFPEGGLTNGTGCMQFSRGFSKFVLPGTPVVPVALRARTPWGIRTHTLTSSFLANLFWLSFCPWVEVEAVVLPPTTQADGEGRGAFVQRVQNQIAEELQVPVSSLTIQQKRQLMRAAQAKGMRRH